MLLGSVLQIVTYAVNASAPPFPCFIIFFIFNGAGMALQDAQANGYVAAQTHGLSAKMGVLHGVYGLGALVSPLVATQFSTLPKWSFHYLTSLGVALINTVALIVVFKGRSQNG
jgi:fucose permease